VNSNRLAGFLLGLLLVGAPALAGVEVHFEKEIDFSAYGTYAWEKGIPAAQPNAEQWIVDAVEAQLQSAGLTKVEGEADLMVSSHAFAEAITSSDVIDPGYWGGGDDFGVPTVSVSDFRKGTLAVRIRDRAEDRVVWRAVSTATLKDASAKKVRNTIERMTQKMFKKFPREAK
jgi:hypothetical protein